MSGADRCEAESDAEAALLESLERSDVLRSWRCALFA